jgi:hypothetical protein
MDDAARSGLRRDRFLLGAVLLGALAHLAMYAPQLPQQMASRFDTAGNAMGYMSRDAFVWTIAITYGVMGGGFLVLAQMMPAFPNALINMPNKEHWLAPERRADSLARLGRALTRFGAVNVALIAFLVHQTFAVNLGQAPSLGGFLPALAAYLIYTVIWCIGLIRQFRLPRDGTPT